MRTVKVRLNAAELSDQMIVIAVSAQSKRRGAKQQARVPRAGDRLGRCRL
jgi:hypothetical protein